MRRADAPSRRTAGEYRRTHGRRGRLAVARRRWRPYLSRQTRYRPCATPGRTRRRRSLEGQGGNGRVRADVGGGGSSTLTVDMRRTRKRFAVEKTHYARTNAQVAAAQRRNLLATVLVARSSVRSGFAI